MTGDTLLSSMQEEYNELIKKAQKASGADKQLINQQLSHISKMMTQVCHSSTQSEIQRDTAYIELRLLKHYLIDNGILDYDVLNPIQAEACELSKKKAEESEKVIQSIYGDFENLFYNRTKADPTAKKAIKNVDVEH